MNEKTVNLTTPFRLIDVAVLAFVAYFALSLGTSITRRDIDARQTSLLLESSLSVI